MNNAGYGDVGRIEDTSLPSFRERIGTNSLGAIIVTQAAIPIMRGAEVGSHYSGILSWRSDRGPWVARPIPLLRLLLGSDGVRPELNG